MAPAPLSGRGGLSVFPFCVVTEWGTFAGPPTKTQLAARHEGWLAARARARLLGRAADWHDAELAERSLPHSQPGPCVEMSVFVLRGLVEVMMRCSGGHRAVGGRMNHGRRFISISTEDASAGVGDLILLSIIFPVPRSSSYLLVFGPSSNVESRVLLGLVY